MNETKSALLAAARQLIGERGYSGTGVRDLSALAGTNLAAVNYHFGTRERLLSEAVLQSFLEWTDHVSSTAAAQPHDGPVTQLVHAVSELLDGFPEREPLFAVVLEAVLLGRRSPDLRTQLAAHYAEQRRRVGTDVRAASPIDGIPDRFVEILAALIIAVADGLMLQSILDPQSAPTGPELELLGCGISAAVEQSRAAAGVGGADETEPST